MQDAVTAVEHALGEARERLDAHSLTRLNLCISCSPRCMRSRTRVALGAHAGATFREGRGFGERVCSAGVFMRPPGTEGKQQRARGNREGEGPFVPGPSRQR